MSGRGLDHVRRGHEAFGRGDMAAVKAETAPDVEWGALSTFPGLRPVYYGHAGLEEWVETVRNEFEEFQVTVGDVLLERDEVVVIEERLQARGRRSGAEAVMSIYAAYWVGAEGIRRRAVFTQREAALEAAGVE